MEPAAVGHADVEHEQIESAVCDTLERVGRGPRGLFDQMAVGFEELAQPLEKDGMIVNQQ
jgi:hypothetical protein